MSTPDGSQIHAVTSYGRSAGSARVRVFDWLDHSGLRADVTSYLDTKDHAPGSLMTHGAKVPGAERALRRLARRTDRAPLILSRQASPFSNGGIEAQILSGGGHTVYDFDDALFEIPDATLRRPWSKGSVWRRAVASASTVIAGNDHLADRASSYASDVVVIPSCVRPEDYVEKADYAVGETPRAVWLGSPSTEPALRIAQDALVRAHEQLGLRLTLISAGDQDLQDLAPLTDRLEWSPSVVARALASADFGIMPLEDTPWSRGKCAYKLLQYGAAALPLVGSPVGVNARVLRDGDGLAPSRSDEWFDAIAELVGESEHRRRQRGAAARAMVEQSFSFAAWESRWRSAVGLPL